MKSRYWWLLGLAAGIAVILLLPNGEDPNMPVTPEPNVGGTAAMICPFDDLIVRCGSDIDFKDCNNCPEMVLVPSGKFMMDTPGNAAWQRDAWSPPHEVRIGKAIAVGKFEITFDEWDACVVDRGCSVIPDDEGWGRGRRPVVNVSWQEAQEYVRWLSALTSNTYRLLSESEWEYATRAGSTTIFPWGDTMSTAQANYDGGVLPGVAERGQWRGKTLPVGSFEPNAFGLYDVIGNVSGWVEDCFSESYKDAPVDGSPRKSCGRDTDNIKARRGGGWGNLPTNVLPNARGGDRQNRRGAMLGFRVALDL